MAAFAVKSSSSWGEKTGEAEGFASASSHLFSGPPFSHWQLPGVLSDRPLLAFRVEGEPQSSVSPSPVEDPLMKVRGIVVEERSASLSSDFGPFVFPHSSPPVRLCASCGESSFPLKSPLLEVAASEASLAREARALASQLLGSASSVESVIAASAVAAGTHRAAALSRKAAFALDVDKKPRGESPSFPKKECFVSSPLDAPLLEQAVRVLRFRLSSDAHATPPFSSSSSSSSSSASRALNEDDIRVLHSLNERRNHLRHCVGRCRQTQLSFLSGGGREVVGTLQICTAEKSVAVVVGNECRLKVQCLYIPICASVAVSGDADFFDAFNHGSSSVEETAENSSSHSVCQRRRKSNHDVPRHPKSQSLWILTVGPPGEEKSVLERIYLQDQTRTLSAESSSGATSPKARIFYSTSFACGGLWTPSRSQGFAFLLPSETANRNSRSKDCPLMLGAGGPSREEGIGQSANEVTFSCCACCVGAAQPLDDASLGTSSSSWVQFSKVKKERKTQQLPLSCAASRGQLFLQNSTFRFLGFCKELPLVVAETKTRSIRKVLFLMFESFPGKKRGFAALDSPGDDFDGESSDFSFVQTASFFFNDRDFHRVEEENAANGSKTEGDARGATVNFDFRIAPSLIFLPFQPYARLEEGSSQTSRLRICLLDPESSELLLFPLCTEALTEAGKEKALGRSEGGSCLFGGGVDGREIARIENALGFCCLRPGGEGALNSGWVSSSKEEFASFERRSFGNCFTEGIRLSVSVPSSPRKGALHFALSEQELPRFLVVLHCNARLRLYGGEVPLQEILLVHPERGLLRGAIPLAVSEPVGCSFNVSLLLLKDSVSGEPLSRVRTYRCSVKLRSSSWLLQLCLDTLLEKLHSPTGQALLVSAFRLCLSPGCASALAFLSEECKTNLQDQRTSLRSAPSLATAEWKAFCTFLFLLASPQTCVCSLRKGRSKRRSSSWLAEGRLAEQAPSNAFDSDAENNPPLSKEVIDATKRGSFMSAVSKDPWLSPLASLAEEAATFAMTAKSASVNATESSGLKSRSSVGLSDEAAAGRVVEAAMFSLRRFEASSDSAEKGLRSHLPLMFLALHFVLEDLLLREDFVRPELEDMHLLMVGLARRLRLPQFEEHYQLLRPAAQETRSQEKKSREWDCDSSCHRCSPPFLLKLRASLQVPSFEKALSDVLETRLPDGAVPAVSHPYPSAFQQALNSALQKRKCASREYLRKKRIAQSGLFPFSPKTDTPAVSSGDFCLQKKVAEEARESANLNGDKGQGAGTLPVSPSEYSPSAAGDFDVAGELKTCDKNTLRMFALPLTNFLLNAVAVARGVHASQLRSETSLAVSLKSSKSPTWKERLGELLRLAVKSGLCEFGLEQLSPPIQLWFRVLLSRLAMRVEVLQLGESLGQDCLKALLLLHRRDAAANSVLLRQECCRAEVGCRSCFCFSLRNPGIDGRRQFLSTSVAEEVSLAFSSLLSTGTFKKSAGDNLSDEKRGSKAGGVASLSLADFLLSSSRPCTARVFVESAASVQAAATEPLQQLQIQALSRHFGLAVGRGALRLDSVSPRNFPCGASQVPPLQTRCEVTPVSTLHQQQSTLFETTPDTRNSQPPLSEAFPWDALDDDEEANCPSAAAALVKLEAVTLPRQIHIHTPAAVVFNNACATGLEVSRHPSLSSFLRWAEMEATGESPRWHCCCGVRTALFHEIDAPAVKVPGSKTCWLSDPKAVRLSLRAVSKQHRSEEAEPSPVQLAGCLLGIALQGQLRSLQPSAWIDLLDDLGGKSREEASAAVGVLLGASASQLGSQCDSLTRLCLLHVSYAAPSTNPASLPTSAPFASFSSSSSYQQRITGDADFQGGQAMHSAGAAEATALISLGLLHFGSGNVQLTRMLSAQIRRPLGGGPSPSFAARANPALPINQPFFRSSSLLLQRQQHCAFAAAWSLGALWAGRTSRSNWKWKKSCIVGEDLRPGHNDSEEHLAFKRRIQRGCDEIAHCVKELLSLANASFAVPWSDASSVPVSAKGGCLGERSGAGSAVFAALNQQSLLLECATAAASGGVASSPAAFGASQTRLLLSPFGSSLSEDASSSLWLRAGSTQNVDASSHAGGAPSGLVGPAAAFALGLALWNSGDENTARAITLPEKPREANEALPVLVAHKVLARALIRWNAVEASHEWLATQLPPLLRLFPGESTCSEGISEETKCGGHSSSCPSASDCPPVRMPYAFLLDPKTRLIVVRRRQDKGGLQRRGDSSVSSEVSSVSEQRAASRMNLFHANSLRAHAVAAALWVVGLRFAGTNDDAVVRFIAEYYEAFAAGKVAAGSHGGSRGSVEGASPFRSSHHWSLEDLAWLSAAPLRNADLNRRVGLELESAALVLRTASTALALVASGSGRADVLKILLRERRRLSSGRSAPGEQQLLHQSLGFLFLGRCRWAFRSTRSALPLALLLLSVQPLNPSVSAFAPQNGAGASALMEWPLNAEMHLYTLAAEPRRLAAVDVDSGCEVPCNVEVKVRVSRKGNSTRRLLVLPCLLPDPSNLLEVRVASPELLPLKVQARRCCHCALRSLLSSGVILVQRVPFSPFPRRPSRFCSALPFAASSDENDSEDDSAKSNAEIKKARDRSEADTTKRRRRMGDSEVDTRFQVDRSSSWVGDGGDTSGLSPSQTNASSAWLPQLRRLLNHAAGSETLALNACAASGGTQISRFVDLRRDRLFSKEEARSMLGNVFSFMKESETSRDGELVNSRSFSDPEALAADVCFVLLPALTCNFNQQFALLQPWLSLAEGDAQQERALARIPVGASTTRQLRLFLQIANADGGESTGRKDALRILRRLFQKCMFRADSSLEEGGGRSVAFEDFLASAMAALVKSCKGREEVSELLVKEASRAESRTTRRGVVEVSLRACYQILHGLPLLSQWRGFLERAMQEGLLDSVLSVSAQRHTAAVALASGAAPSASAEGRALLREVLTSAFERLGGKRHLV